MGLCRPEKLQGRCKGGLLNASSSIMWDPQAPYPCLPTTSGTPPTHTHARLIIPGPAPALPDALPPHGGQADPAVLPRLGLPAAVLAIPRPRDTAHGNADAACRTWVLGEAAGGGRGEAAAGPQGSADPGHVLGLQGTTARQVRHIAA